MALRILRSLTTTLYPLQGTGLPRLAEWIRRQVAVRYAAQGRAADFWIDDFMGRLRFCCDLRDHMGSQIFFRGAYSDDQLLLVKALLPQPGVFVDVGANQGEFSVFAASLCEGNQVLQGAQHTISTHRPVLMFEASEQSAAAAGYRTEDLFRLVEAHDYALHMIDHGGTVSALRRNAVFCNVLAIPAEREALVKAEL